MLNILTDEAPFKPLTNVIPHNAETEITYKYVSLKSAKMNWGADINISSTYTIAINFIN